MDIWHFVTIINLITILTLVLNLNNLQKDYAGLLKRIEELESGTDVVGIVRDKHQRWQGGEIDSFIQLNYDHKAKVVMIKEEQSCGYLK